METALTKPDIPESAIEHRVLFSSHWIEKWGNPNPFVALFLEILQSRGVGLKDISFAQNPKNVSESKMHVSVDTHRTTILIGLDNLTFLAINPDWQMAPHLVDLLDLTLEAFRKFVSVPVKSQETVLAFHVTPGEMNFGQATAGLVNAAVLGESEFFGVTTFSAEKSLSLERSLKYSGGAFFRLTRTFGPNANFAEIALAIHSDEVSALKLLHIEGLI